MTETAMVGVLPRGVAASEDFGDLGTLLQKVGGERVPERVRLHALLDPTAAGGGER
jgi:hypothetical protein